MNRLLSVHPSILANYSLSFPKAGIIFERNAITAGYFSILHPASMLSITKIKKVLGPNLRDAGISVVSYKELTNMLYLPDGTPVTKRMIVDKTSWYFVSESDRRVYSGASRFKQNGIFVWYEAIDVVIQRRTSDDCIRQKPMRLFSVSSKKKHEAFTVWYEDAVDKVALLNKMRGVRSDRGNAIIGENELANGYNQGQSIFEIIANCADGADGASYIVVPPIEHIPVAAFTREVAFLTY